MKVDFKYDRERPKIVIPDGFIMIQDVREKKPIFEPAPWIINQHLKTGDYSIKGFEDMITIERKSIVDLYGSMSGGRKKLEKELERMKKMKWYGMMIEGCEDKVLRKQSYAKMEPNQMYHSLCSFELRGVHIYYAKLKQDARDWILSRLTRFYNHVRRGDVV